MELTLFVIIGAIAVAAAAMMLISENAVHSALFLILNLACIAFFFLMLHAPFLAMVQITVYAGAIMVLFLFVIMLLGAERMGEEERRSGFPWLSPVALVLALVFLITSSLAIVRGDIELTEEKVVEPRVRVVNALDLADVAAIDVYLDGTLVADNVAFGDSSEFDGWARGRYTMSLFAAGADPAQADPLFPQPDTPAAAQQVELNSGEAVSLTALSRLDEGAFLVAAAQDVDPNDDDELSIVAINALHGRSVVDVLKTSRDDEPLIEDLAFGEASAPVSLDEGTYSIGVYPDGDTQIPLVELKDEELERNTSVLWVFAERQTGGNAWETVPIKLETKTRPSFGSPTHVGQLLFSRYVLPFEMVALVLLVAMIGAIVLTHETLGAPRRIVRRLANPPASGDVRD